MLQVTGPSITIQINKIVKNAKRKTMTAIRETIVEVNNQIVAGTPVRRGKLKKSYYAAINSMPTGAYGAGGQGYNSVARKVKPGDKYYFINVAPYARRIHYGFVGRDKRGRQYNQPGKYWMNNVLFRFGQIAQSVARKYANK